MSTLITVNAKTGEINEIPDSTPMLDNNVFLAREIRLRRNALLRESDWTQAADSPMTAGQKLGWITYRQALRNVSAQATFPQSVIWPTPPAF